jgi:hypothetical protein
MFPHERSLVRRLADKPFAIIGVNSDKDLESIRNTTKEKSITWRSFWNGELGTKGPISTEWCVTGWPTTYLIDKDGVIRYKNVRGGSLDKALEKLMEEIGETVELVGVDHEAEDEAALAAAKEAVEGNVDDDSKVDADVKSAEKEKAKEESDG